MMRARTRLAAALAAAALLAGPAVVGQSAPKENPALSAVEAEEAKTGEVVVTARRIGVPVWRVGSNLILVGHIRAVPKGTKWRPEELSKAVAQADSVVFPHDETATPADVARVLWRARSIVLLPKGKTLDDYVDAETLSRVRAARRARGEAGDAYRYMHPWTTADDLLESVGAEQNIGPDLADIVRKEVRRQRKQRKAVAVLRAKGWLDAFFNEGPSAHAPCLKAALDAVEAQPGVAARRIQDYTRYRVAAVVRSPVERAFGACWLQGGGETISAKLRADWRTRLTAQADAPGVTLAVVPLRFLAEEGGLLDAFAAAGRPIEGPRWRD